jgi:hypothetical protein
MERDGDGVTLGDHGKKGSSGQILNKPGMPVCAIKYYVHFPASHARQIKR